MTDRDRAGTRIGGEQALGEPLRKGSEVRAIIDAALRLGLVAALIFVCYKIAEPFIGVLLWAAILAIMMSPLHEQIRRRLGVGAGLSAAIFGLAAVALMLVPTSLVLHSLAQTALGLVSGLRDHTLALPPAPARLSTLPIIGSRLSAAWSLAQSNLPAALRQYEDILKPIALRLAKIGGGLAGGLLSFMLSLILAAILLAYGEPAGRLARDSLSRVTDSEAQGARLTGLIVKTIRSVAQGIIGVAFIQAALVGVGFFAIGLPFAGVLTAVLLVFGIVQGPALLITLPAIIYVFTTHSTLPAGIFAAWTLLASISDNLLKPILLGRGLEAPMPVILIGVIGGVVAGGLLGLFTGPVVLAVGYVLFIDWLKAPDRNLEAA
jgi:predicted PurR-regulated permease PerM